MEQKLQKLTLAITTGQKHLSKNRCTCQVLTLQADLISL